MTHDEELDEKLKAGFAGIRADDARSAPAFASMLAKAKAGVPSEVTAAPVPVPLALPPAPLTAPIRRSPWRWAYAAAPLAVAAGLAAVWLGAPSRAADREFERLVSEYSRTERILNAPTDGLLAVPGSEYLRRLPALGSGAGATRRPT